MTCQEICELNATHRVQVIICPVKKELELSCAFINELNFNYCSQKKLNTMLLEIQMLFH